MKKLFLSILLSLSCLISFSQVADINRTTKTPLSGSNAGNQSVRDYNLTAVGRFYPPKYANNAAFNAINAKDSTSIYWNTTINKLIIRRQGGVFDTLSTTASADLINYYTKIQVDSLLALKQDVLAFAEGLTKNLDTVKLGGELLNYPYNMQIGGGVYNYDGNDLQKQFMYWKTAPETNSTYSRIGDSGWTLQSYGDYNALGGGFLLAGHPTYNYPFDGSIASYANGISFDGSQFLIKSTVGGVKYSANYSAGFTDRSLIDKGYLTGALANYVDLTTAQTIDATKTIRKNAIGTTVTDGLILTNESGGTGPQYSPAISTLSRNSSGGVRGFRSYTRPIGSGTNMTQNFEYFNGTSWNALATFGSAGSLTIYNQSGFGGSIGVNNLTATRGYEMPDTTGNIPIVLDDLSTSSIIASPSVRSVKVGLALKQDLLSSGTNIKTVGGVSLLGSGDVSAPTFSTVGATTFTGALNGNATTVTNGVYTTTLNGLGDARWLQLSGGNLTGSLGIGGTATSQLHVFATGATPATFERAGATNISIEFKNGSGSFFTGKSQTTGDFVINTSSSLSTTPKLSLTTAGNLSIAGTATFPTVNVTGATASTIAGFDVSKNLVSLATATYPSLTELSYVKGVTSAIQTQLNAKGAGTVTSVSVVTANGVSGTVATSTTTPAITLSLGNITPTAVTAGGTVSANFMQTNGIDIRTNFGAYFWNAANTFSAQIVAPTVTANRLISLPNEDGTVALNENTVGLSGNQTVNGTKTYTGLVANSPTLITPIETKSISTITSNFTITIGNYYTLLADATSGGITATLPTASSASGRIYVLKKIDSSVNTVTIDGNGSELIDGATTQVIAVQWASLTIQSNGTAWYIIAKN